MTDYFGTKKDDLIDVSKLATDVVNIYPEEGDDTVTNAGAQHTIISSPGRDNISGKNTGYALWQANVGVTINLKEGWSEDGFGTIDELSGIQTIHGSGKGDTFFGTHEYERYFANGGNNILYMGGGDDRVSYAAGNSKDYTVSLVDDEIHVIGPRFKDIIIGGRYVEFMEDNRIIDTSYLSSKIKSTLIKEVYSFKDSTRTEEYTYAGVTYPEQLLGWFTQKVFLFDVNLDGDKDIIFPIAKGYAQVGNYSTYTPFIALTVNNGSLEYNEEINSFMPIANTAGRTKPIYLKATDSDAFVSANIHNDAGVKDLTLKPYSQIRLTQNIYNRVEAIDIFPNLPDSTVDFPLAEDAHSMATGDINGDGLDDIYIGRMKSDGGYELIQNNDGTFYLNRQDIYKKIQRWPLENKEKTDHINGGIAKNLHLDSELFDANNDGFDDLLIGFGHGSASSKLFINDQGNFSETKIIKMPDSIYGVDNQMHLVTLIHDFDHDNDEDVAILWTRYEPYYAGSYLQINQNDGTGQFIDITNQITDDPFLDAYNGRLTWVEPWQIIDVNDDGHFDIAGSRSSGTSLIYINDGAARFSIQEIKSEEIKGKPHAYGDFDKDGKLEYISFESFGNSEQNETTISFNLYEVDKRIGTGPDFLKLTANQGAPGFNEKYYLNENLDAKKLVDDAIYDNGLAHYLAEGKEAGLKIFAPYTKVHGYPGNDTIILREGNEIAFGYGGNDLIEGGAGDDMIDGGTGIDIAIFRDTYESYNLIYSDDGTLIVRHTPESSDLADEGTDTLVNIEKLQFSDQIISAIQSKYSLSSKIDPSKNILTSFSETAKSGTLNFSSGNNIIIADGQAKTLRGLDGNDIYFISNLLPRESSIEIIDTSGSNIIQIAANTKIIKTLWTKDATRLTFENNKVITINGADNFTFNMGGNVTNGLEGVDLTFSEFAISFGIDDVLNLSGSDNGTITDMYII